jgi:uncharacterized membrane protein
MTALLVALTPAAALYGVHASKFLRSIGAVVLCFVGGVILGNLGLAPDAGAAKTASTLGVALAIPLLLLSTDLRGWLRSARPAVISYSLVCLSSCAAAWLGGKIFAAVPQAREVAGMLAAVYIGGTPNMSALAVALDVREEIFLVVNGGDMILSTLYLLFMTSVAVRVLGKFLPPTKREETRAEAADFDGMGAYKSLSSAGKLRAAGTSLAVALSAAALSAGLSHLLFGRLDEIFMIFGITTLGFAGSFSESLHGLRGSFGVGNYLLLIFCAAVGTMTRVDRLAAADPRLFYMVAFILIGALLLHLLLAALLRIDVETVIITSVAGILSPAFVVITAAALGNRALLAPGITSGLVGYAVANYLGWLVYRLL